jgi:hypothetical protein
MSDLMAILSTGKDVIRWVKRRELPCSDAAAGITPAQGCLANSSFLSHYYEMVTETVIVLMSGK